MDNWLFFLLGLIFAIPLGIFTNIVTPWVKAYFDKSSLSSKKKE